MVTYGPSCVFFSEQLHTACPWGRQATVHPYPRQLPFTYSLSSNLRAITFWRRWWLFWKRESYLGLLVDSNCLKARDKQFWRMQFLSIFWKRHILCWNIQGPFQPKPFCISKKRKKSKPTVCIFHLKIVAQRCSVSKALSAAAAAPQMDRIWCQLQKQNSQASPLLSNPLGTLK